MTLNERAVLAAVNNAAWCDAVCQARNATTRFDATLWRNQSISPPYFPNIITTARGTPIQAVWDALRTVPDSGKGVGVKDSFCEFDLSSFGLKKFIEAFWVWREADQPLDCPTEYSWRQIECGRDLRRWEQAWWPEGVNGSEAVFDEAILRRTDVRFLAAYQGECLIAGAAVTRTAGGTGVTCTFYRGKRPLQARRELINVVAEVFPGPVLGYASGGELEVLKSLGFFEVQALRIWLGTPNRSS